MGRDPGAYFYVYLCMYMYMYVYICAYLYIFNKLFDIFPPSYPLRRYGPRLRNNNNNDNHFVQRTTGLHPSGELFTAGAPTPTSLGELLLINGIIDQPNPSYPALCLQDTTHSWSSDDQATNSCMPLLQQWYIPPVPRGTPVPGGARLIRTTCGLWDPAHTYHLCLVGPESTPGGAQAGNY